VLGSGQAQVVTRAGYLETLSAAGALLWKIPLGAPAAAAPVVLSDGSTAIMTAAADVVAVSQTGTTLWRTRLPVSRGLTATLLPLPDGTLVVSSGRQLLHLESGGGLRRRESIGHPVGNLLLFGGSIVVVTDRGEVYLWKPAGSLKLQGSLGGSLRTGPALSGTLLVAATGAGHLVNFDLDTGEMTRRWPKSPWRVALPPAVSPGGAVSAISDDGHLLIEDTAGSLSIQVELAQAPEGASTADPAGSLQPGPIVDEHGTVAFALTGGHIGVATHLGSVRLADVRGCRTPVGLAPAGRGRIIVACGSGQLVSLRQRAPRDAEPAVTAAD
jgi:outer membrane protein assembly factor BamB